MMAASLLVYLMYPVVRVFYLEQGLTFRNFNRILSVPYFPLQIAMGAAAGWYTRHNWRKTFAPLVWILPLLHFCVCIGTFQTSVFLDRPWHMLLDHFLGSGCRPPQCWDQMLCVAPLYSSVAYVFGSYSNRIASRKEAERTSRAE